MSDEKKSIKLNGLTIEVKSPNIVRIKDKMSNCTDLEAAQICSYLLQEGFLDESKQISCEIVQY
jgi:hypothetical protein